ncbi:MAG: hypothetical protein ACJ8KX_10235, partial [Chthoniobacterales bacterium]
RTDSLCPTCSRTMGGMTWDKTNEPVLFGTEQLREILEDYAATTSHLMDALHAAAESGELSNWRPHIPQMHAALAHFAELCSDEIEDLSRWCADGRDLEEVHESVWNEGERLVRWLNRMLGAS